MFEMPDTTCPHCRKEIPPAFLNHAEKDRQIKCPLCERFITINQEGEIIPRSSSFGEAVSLST